MTIIRAIDTEYAGHRMRSRLEARWAIFFDALNIDWEYEPQGIETLTPSGRVRYLPDFRLDNGQWVEVKGALDRAGIRKLKTFAAYLSICGMPDSNDLVVFGNIPRPHSIAWPTQLHLHDNVLWGFPWSLDPECPTKRPPEKRRCVNVGEMPEDDLMEHLIKGFPWTRPGGYGFPEVDDALYAARSARFEWGEHGGRRG